MYTYSDIKTLHLEVTQKCQASCPMCERNQNGGELNPHIDLSELTLQDCKHMFDPSFIKQLNVMYMCGNLGDPIIAKDTLEIFKYFRLHNPNIWLSMNTNAGAREEDWWKQIADVFGNMGIVVFSVDGLSDTNHLYRQGVNWDIVYRNINAFINAGGRARWDFLIFEHNQHQVEEARLLSQKLGFEKFIAKKTSRFLTANSLKKDIHQSINQKGDLTTKLKKPKIKYQNAALVKQELIISKYGSLDAYYDAVPINCKVKNEGNLFITAEGIVLPCCWTAGRMYKWWHKDPKVEQIWKFIDLAGGKDAINAKIHGLKKIFETNIFDNIENSWSKSSCNNGKLKICSITCGIELDLYQEQFK